MEHLQRLDRLMVVRGLASGRDRAKELCESGVVRVDGRKAEKASELVPESAYIEIEKEDLFVSRGGQKLEKMLSKWEIRLDGRTALDVGASTGGFTDCMLRRGAERIYAVDVGHGQLHPNLRADPRVVCLEDTDIRALDPGSIEKADFFTVDVSFVSLAKIMPHVVEFLNRDSAEGVLLVKPQFEAGRAAVGKNGIVRARADHVRAIDGVRTMCENLGFQVIDLDFSPICGRSGNIEYLLYISCLQGRGAAPASEGIVDRAFLELRNG